MNKKQSGLLVVFIFIVSTMLISACTQSLSSAPAETPTSLPTGLFVSPFPSVENPMAMIEQFAKETAAAQTSIAGGNTPAPAGTPQANTTPAANTPQAGATATPGVAVPSTPTNAVATTPAPVGLTPVAPSGPTAVAVAPGTVPQSYVLREGEWPYCIARRFDVDPDALLTASGLTSPDLYSVGQELKIPQKRPFPGPRVLVPHPVQAYTVSAGETIYSIACKFGDLYPENIASANGLSASANLTAGQTIKIP